MDLNKVFKGDKTQNDCVSCLKIAQVLRCNNCTNYYVYCIKHVRGTIPYNVVLYTNNEYREQLYLLILPSDEAG